MNFLKSLKFLFMPRFWIMLGNHRDYMDDLLLNIIKEDLEPVFDHEYYFASFGEVHIWIKNYPYGYGVIGYSNDRASRSTILKFDKWISKKIAEGYKNEK